MFARQLVSVQELMAYSGFDDRDHARLRELHGRIAPELPAIADRFYAAVFASPGATAVLTSPEQVERLRVTLIEWMSSGLLGPYDAAFYDRRSRIGRRHVQIGLAQHYMFGAMSVVREAYFDRIAALYPPADVFPVARSVGKLFDIELALMLRHYQLDSEQKLVAREHAMQADRLLALQTMTGGLAHEVRNPLNAAKLQLELLERRLRKGNHDERLLEPTELASHEMSRLTNLLNDFLSFARAPALHARDHDVVAIVRQVIDLERMTAERGQTKLRYIGPASAVSRVDPDKLHQVIQNLVRNAIEATPGGNVDVSVELDEAPERRVHVRVVDNGPGIPEDVQRRIFEPFYSTKSAGTGLGLSIAHTLVSMHGGTIEVASSVAGTRFDVALPFS